MAGWMSARKVPDDQSADSEGGYVRFADISLVINDDNSTSSVPSGVNLMEHPFSKQVGPRDANGKILWPYAVRKLSGVLSIEVTDHWG